MQDILQQVTVIIKCSQRCLAVCHKVSHRKEPALRSLERLLERDVRPAESRRVNATGTQSVALEVSLISNGSYNFREDTRFRGCTCFDPGILVLIQVHGVFLSLCAYQGWRDNATKSRTVREFEEFENAPAD
jgi:hypothetical protein